ncbi:MAG: hypothetical protein ACAH80_17420 [Alphaproteobacteria bacterium]
MSVSVAALVSAATSSQAVQPAPLVLGVLKPLDSWKVGTVDAQGASFCAMVNKYSSGVGLAFARSPEGYGSVALDLRDNVFKYNQSYEVTLKSDQAGTRTLPGKATSQRSLVVQIGEDKALYDGLKRNGTLQLTLDGVDISFALSKFSSSYKNLVNCATKLNGSSGATSMPAVKVKQVEQQALAPIDRELEQLSTPSIGGATAELAAAENASSLDEQLEAAATADVTEFKTKVASLDKKHAELSQQVETRRDEAAVIEEKKEKVERKLLASVKADKAVASAAIDEAGLPAATGLTARELEQREMAASAQAQKAIAEAEIAQQAAAKAQAEAAASAAAKKEIAEAETAQQAAAKAQAEAAASDAAKKAIAEAEAAKQAAAKAQAEVAALSAQKAAQQAELDRKKAELVAQQAAQQAELDRKKAELAAQQAAQQAELDRKQAALAALEAEKNAAAERHVAAFTRKEHEAAEKAAQLAREAEALKAEKAAAAEDNKALKAKLVSKEAQLAGVAAAREGQVVELTKKLAGTQNEYQTKITSLQGERDGLAQRLAESEAKAKRIQQASTEAATYAKSLEKQLVSSEDARLALETRLAGIEKTATNLIEKQKGLTASAADASATAKELTAVKAELETVKAASAKYQKEIADKTALYTALQGDYAQLQSQGSKMADQGTSLSRQHKELTLQLTQKQEQVTTLESKIATLEAERAAAVTKAENAIKDLVAASRETKKIERKSLVVVNDDELPKLVGEAAANRKALSAAEAQIEQLKSEKTEIEQKLAAKENAPAPGLSPQQMAELDNARAEAETLRKANAELSDKLAAAAAQNPSKGEKAGIIASQAEIEALRNANADLQQRLAERSEAAPALTDGERAELAAARMRVNELEAQIAVTKTPAPVVADTGAIEARNAKLAKAQDEINRLRSEKSSLEQKLVDRAPRTARTTAPVPVEPDMPESYIAPVTSALAATEPGAGDPFEDMPAVPATPVEQDHFSDNRAAAFLDSIMAHHRPAGEAPKVAARPVAEKPVYAAAVKSTPPIKSYPAFKVAKSAPVKAVPAYAPVVAQAPRKSLSPAAVPAYIDEAASLGDQGGNGMTPMPSDDDFAAAPAPVRAPVRASAPSLIVTSEPAPVRPATSAPVASGKPVSIEGLLDQSGLHGIGFKSVDAGPGESVRQWTSGEINGMYEQTPATSDFGYAVQSYLDRYRDDCQGKLQVKLGKPRTTAAGTIAQADIACPIQSNTYNSSFVFVQGGGTFNAILHTGYPQEAAQVKQISDNIAAAVGASGGFTGTKTKREASAANLRPALAVTVPASAPPAAAPQRRFNIQPEAAPATDGEFETVIVQ